MHMQNELLSMPIAIGGFAISGSWLSYICHKSKEAIYADKLPLMGILGAFVFAAQMINFPLPLFPGTSSHLIGALLLSIVVGPNLGAIAISSVVIVQCLVFQDGGLLALGCNILNMALVPSYLGYWIYNLILHNSMSPKRLYASTIVASIVAIEAAAALVPIEVSLSGVLKVPFTSFLLTMETLHLITSVIEGFITAAVVTYILKVRPQVINTQCSKESSYSLRKVFATFAIATLIMATVLSILASEKPDALEWSYKERPDQANFEPIIDNNSEKIQAVDDFASKIAIMPDYSSPKAKQSEAAISNGWTSLAGVLGALITMGLIWTVTTILKPNNTENKP